MDKKIEKKKYFVLAHENDRDLVETVMSQIRCLRKYLVQVKDLSEADIVLVFVSPSLVGQSEMVTVVNSLPNSDSVRVIPILTKPCLWREILDRVAESFPFPYAKPGSGESKWLSQFGESTIDGVAMDIAGRVASHGGYVPQMIKD